MHTIRKYGESCCGCLKPVRQWLNQSSSGHQDFLTAPFEIEIKFIFEDFEMENKDCKGFSNAIRSLLVDNILRNLSFDPQNDQDIIPEVVLNNSVLKTLLAPNVTQPNSNVNILSKLKQKLVEKKIVEGIVYDDEDDNKDTILYSGLHYMLENEYFNDAFILHDETNEEFDKIISEMTQENASHDANHLELLKSLSENKKEEGPSFDTRLMLSKNWAGIKNVFRFQPLWHIQNYFGEYIAFYFAFCGSIISYLWVPTFTGIAFFVVGAINKYKTF